MDFIYKLFKNIFFLLFFGIDLEDIEDEESFIEKNPKNNLENQNFNIHKQTTFTYLKFILITSLSLISLIILINFLNYDINLEKLQNLLNELATTVDWNLYRDIFLNIQKIISATADKNTTLYVLKEIHSFFLLNTNQVYDLKKFDKIMKEIISLLSREN